MTRLSDAISLNRVSGLRRKATGMVSISVSSRSSRICLRIGPLPNPSLNRLQGLFASLHGVLQNLLEFQLFLLRERLHTSHHRNLNGDLSITHEQGKDSYADALSVATAMADPEAVSLFTTDRHTLTCPRLGERVRDFGESNQLRRLRIIPI